MSRFSSLPTIANPSEKLKSLTEERSRLPTVQELVARESLKKIALWFKSWRHWQQRIFVCHIMEYCSKHQLHVLATVLEPVLHIGFSSSLVPHLASLHVDGAAKFQIQRGMLQRMFSAESMGPDRTNVATLPSLPTTLLSSETTSNHGSGTVQGGRNMAERDVKSERVVLPPALPLTHAQHVPLSPESSLEDVFKLRHTRFSSVPDFQSTTDLLRGVKHKDLFRPKATRHHRRSQSLGSYMLLTKPRKPSLSQKHQEAELFKTQLTSTTEWMSRWPAKQKSQLLLEIVKLCNKDLLAYFVQCLYQRLHDHSGIEILSDTLLLRIFSFLDPKSLCQCAQVCQRWYRLSNTAQLWEEHCHQLGEREGVGDLVGAVKSVCEQKDSGTVNWKEAYKELSNVIWRIRQLVLKTAEEKDEKEREIIERRAASKLTKAALRAQLSLRQMIELVRCRSHTPLSSIQEVLQSSPESATVIRRRNRREREALEEERLREESERALSSRYQHRRPYDRSTLSSRLEGLIQEEDESVLSVHHPHKSTTPDIIELICEAQDRRSGLHYLPNPDGVRCLILAGCLLTNQSHRPGKTQPIPRLRRLPPLYSTVLCLQCDQKKIVSGMQSREIQIHDIRSGRLVNTLCGHKGSVQCLQFDDNKIVSGSWDTTCIVWDVVHGVVVQQLYGHTECISCLKFNELKLITGSHDKSIRVWSTTTWECITVIGHAHKGAVQCVALNTAVIASGGEDRCVRLWSLGTYKPLAILPHSASLTSLLISNLLLVSACQSGTVYLWSLEPHHTKLQHTVDHNTPIKMKTLSQANLLDSKEESTIVPLYTPVTCWELEDGVYLTNMVLEGDKIFACGSGCSIYEWDISTGMFTRSLIGHSRPLTGLGITQNKLVSAAEDHTVCVWYYKKTKSMSKIESDGLLMEDSDPTFPDIPIRIITH